MKYLCRLITRTPKKRNIKFSVLAADAVQENQPYRYYAHFAGINGIIIYFLWPGLGIGVNGINVTLCTDTRMDALTKKSLDIRG